MLTGVVGTQFGDEGKGAVVHRLSLSEDIVAGARAQGGNNAGHTIVLPDEDEPYKLHLVPSSVIAGKKGFIGRGCVVDLEVLVQEIAMLRERGHNPDVVLDPCAHVILPWHKALDTINNKKQGNFSAGSTGRGIGPAYGAKHERWGVRVDDLFENKERVQQVLDVYVERLEKDAALFNIPADTKTFRKNVEKIKTSFSSLYPCIVSDVSVQVEKLLQRGEGVLGECAQGEMLDVNNPYYPYGTSSETNAPGLFVGLGVGLKRDYIGPMYGVAKAYTSRVGDGPFPTEIKGKLGNAIRKKGNEYGTTTGRPRRVGWFDAVIVRAASRASGLEGLVLTKIDVLGGMDMLEIATEYRIAEKYFQDQIPPHDYASCALVTEHLFGWTPYTKEGYQRQFANGVSHIEDTNLRKYLEAIERTTELPILMISFGAESDAFISYV